MVPTNSPLDYLYRLTETSAVLSLYEATVRLLGRGFDSRHLHQKNFHQAMQPRASGAKRVLLMGMPRFRQVLRSEVDNVLGDEHKSRKIVNANDSVYSQALAA